MESVREAVPDDAGRFGELVGEFLAALAGQRGGALLAAHPSGDDRAPLSGQLSDLLGADDGLVLVGTLDDQVMGVAVCHHEDRHELGRQGVIELCYVEPGARGVGLGRRLLDTATAWLDGQGCAGVDGLALPGDRSAKRLFEDAGFKARLITMHRPLH